MAAKETETRTDAEKQFPAGEKVDVDANREKAEREVDDLAKDDKPSGEDAQSNK